MPVSSLLQYPNMYIACVAAWWPKPCCKISLQINLFWLQVLLLRVQLQLLESRNRNQQSKLQIIMVIHIICMFAFIAQILHELSISLNW